MSCCKAFSLFTSAFRHEQKQHPYVGIVLLQYHYVIFVLTFTKI